MRWSTPAVAALGVSVCACSKFDAWQHPEIAACEDFTKAKLKAPATFKRAKVSTIDEQISLETWDAIQKARVGRMAEQFRDLTEKHQKAGGVRSVLLEYDADNSFGTPLRGMEVCKFLMSSFAEDEFVTEPSSDSAKLSRMIWQLEDEDSQEPACCMTVAESKALGRPAGTATR